MKLNIGCGTDIREGWVNADKYCTGKGIVFADMEERLPFKDNTFNECFLRCSVEHVKNQFGLFEELYRVSKHKARITIITAHCSSIGAMADLDHYQEYNWWTLDRLNKLNKRSYQTNCDLRLVKREYIEVIPNIVKGIFNRHCTFAETIGANYFPIQKIEYVLEAIKEVK